MSAEKKNHKPAKPSAVSLKSVNAAQQSGHDELLNPGTSFNAEWVNDIRINQSAVERRSDSLKARRSPKKNFQAAWLL